MAEERDKNREEKDLWEKFWKRDRDIRKVYSNEGRVYDNLAKIVDVRGKRVLEVGGGSGRDSLQLNRAGADTFVLDYTMAPLELVRSQSDEENTPHLICGDALALPLKDDCVDIVFHQGLMEHFREPGPLLEENRRVMRRGGFLLVDVPQRYHVYTILKVILIRLDRWFAGWETQYSIRELEKIIKDHRMDIVHSYGDWMAPNIFYRLLREVMFLVGIELPLYPRSPFRAIRKAADRTGAWLRKRRISFYSFHVIGVIGRKPDR